MNCEQVRNVLDAFLNDRMSGEASRAVRLHLASCASCASMLGSADRIEILPALDETIEPSEDFAVRFHSKLQQQKAAGSPAYSEDKPKNVWFFWRRPWQLATVGALAAVLAAGIFVRQVGDGVGLPEDSGDLMIAEDLSLLEDMPVISNLDLLENFDAIEKMTPAPEGFKEQGSID